VDLLAEILELDPQHRGLNRVESAIYTNILVFMRHLAVVHP
jgi:hypothetical protein